MAHTFCAMTEIKLGYGAGYWSAGPPPGAQEAILEAERLGFDSMWTAEAYGSDAFTPLAWWGARTERLRLGTGIVQLSARTPTATAMAALTLDHLSGGRVLLGLGVSGPQVVEGWYGQPYPRPLARTREYFEVLRQTIARERVEHDGAQIQIPYVDKYGMKSTGLGKALRSTLHPVRDQIPLLLAAEGPKNIALSAEIADGWLPFFYSPWDADFAHTALEEGFARRAPERLPRDQFEIACPVQVIVSDDLEAAADWIRPFIALYVGGMGAKGANFHFDAVARLGYEEVCAKIQDLYLEGRKDEATAAVPLDLVEKIALIGPKEKIRDDLAAWNESVVTTLMVGGDADTLRMMAELVL